MAIAVVLILIVLGSIAFHFWSPWTVTPLASNWGSIDDTMVITLIITGIVFIAVNFFVAFAVIKFRHKEGQKARYEPENKKLELWLTVLTSIGIIAMLAPGLVVYADFVNVPEDAMEVEVVGQQWSWSFRFPGKDGVLGKSAVEYITIDNPFGLDPLDEQGQDDVLVMGNQVSLPLNQPVKVLLRSKDVLHDFYVPQFRVKMDMVPGTVSYLWFTPTLAGEFEILCAEFCGLGHFNMRGKVNVMSQEEFKGWLAQQSTFADSLNLAASQTLSVKAQQGEDIAQAKGCLACHNFSNSDIGPSWQGLLGSTRVMADGSEILADEDYLKRAMLEPAVEVVKGFAPIMPAVHLTELEVDALISYIREKGADAEQTGDAPDLSGEQLAQSKGCTACHSVDGTRLVGPSWQGLYQSNRELASGQSVVADEDYLHESIFAPNQKIVAGYPPVMPPPMLSEAEAQAIISYIKTL